MIIVVSVDNLSVAESNSNTVAPILYSHTGHIYLFPLAICSKGIKIPLTLEESIPYTVLCLNLQ